MKSGADKTILKKLYIKTVAAAATLIMVITMSVSVTYAWLILSTSPTASGAQISLAGGNTILLAPDVTEVVDDVTVHYPGAFSDKVSLSYDYLKQVAGLSPVSTADGINWIVAGENGYAADTTLEYANMTAYRSTGNYIYLDFWVVSPGSDYTLRVSSGTGTGGRGGNGAKDGSSLVEFPVVEADGSSFTISEPDGTGAAAAVRIGFLVNTSKTDENQNLLSYQQSEGYNGRYGAKLLGKYQEPGEQLPYGETYRFTIYEPNGTSHKGDDNDGKYIITKPLKNAAGDVEDDISGILTVQTKSVWKFNGGNVPLNEQFDIYVNSTSDELTADNAAGKFFKASQWYLTPYITPGSFFKNTSSLYEASSDGEVSAAAAGNLLTAGATDSVYITTLTRNVPQRIRMFIWLEGQDADCKNVANGATDFIINLELAGADQ